MRTGELEIVNHHARKTLIEPIERALSENRAIDAAQAVLAVLEDADEVVEVYLDESQLASVIV